MYRASSLDSVLTEIYAVLNIEPDFIYYSS